MHPEADAETNVYADIGCTPQAEVNAFANESNSLYEFCK